MRPTTRQVVAGATALPRGHDELPRDRNVGGGGGRGLSARLMDERISAMLGYDDNQHVRVYCVLDGCTWTWEGAFVKVRELARLHRVERHPDAPERPTPRRAGKIVRPK